MSLIGTVSPDVVAPAVINGTFRKFYLAVFDRHWILLLFYPFNFPKNGRNELKEMSEMYKEFFALDCVVIGISTETHFSNLAFVMLDENEGGLGGNCTFPLVSDKTFQVSRAFAMLDEYEGISKKGHVFVNPQNVIAYIDTQDCDAERDADMMLRTLKRLQAE